MKGLVLFSGCTDCKHVKENSCEEKDKGNKNLPLVAGIKWLWWLPRRMLHLRDGHSHYFQFVGEKERKRNSQVQSNARCGGNSVVRNSTLGFSLYWLLTLLCFVQKKCRDFPLIFAVPLSSPTTYSCFLFSAQVNVTPFVMRWTAAWAQTVPIAALNCEPPQGLLRHDTFHESQFSRVIKPDWKVAWTSNRSDVDI